MLASLISAGSNIIGGIMGSREKDKDRQLQKDFAQQGIQWKVADAKAAGIHPLAALGAQTTSYQPVGVGGDLSTGLAAAGQDISRAVDATRSASQKVDAYTRTVQALNVQRMGLENELLGSQIAKVKQAGSNPPMPTSGDRYLLDGQADSGLVATEAMRRQASAPGALHQEAGAVADSGYARTSTGWAPVYSKDVKDRLEEDLAGSLAWNLRNRLGPTVSPSHHNPPQTGLKGGEMWVYDPFKQEYVKMKRRGHYLLDYAN